MSEGNTPSQAELWLALLSFKIFFHPKCQSGSSVRIETPRTLNVSVNIPKCNNKDRAGQSRLIPVSASHPINHQPCLFGCLSPWQPPAASTLISGCHTVTPATSVPTACRSVPSWRSASSTLTYDVQGAGVRTEPFLA